MTGGSFFLYNDIIQKRKFLIIERYIMLEIMRTKPERITAVLFLCVIMFCMCFVPVGVARGIMRKQALDRRYKSLLVTVGLSMRAKVPLCSGEAPAPVSVL